jgi:hypothetical protein
MKYRHFAVLGSGAVILAIAFDPFVQNLIHYYPKLVVDPTGTAIVSSNTIYDGLGPLMNIGKILTGILLTWMPLTQVFSGLLS